MQTVWFRILRYGRRMVWYGFVRFRCPGMSPDVSACPQMSPHVTSGGRDGETNPISGRAKVRNRQTQCVLDFRTRSPDNGLCSGRSSAWLERLVWDQEVASSNLVAPTCRASSGHG